MLAKLSRSIARSQVQLRTIHQILESQSIMVVNLMDHKGEQI